MDISELVVQAKSGDNKAFDELYKLTEKQVWFTCISFLKNETNAKDVMQETYITAFLKLKSLKDCKHYKAWLNKIAINKCKDFLKMSSKGDIQLDEEILENELIENEPMTVPEEYVIDKEKREHIISIMLEVLTDVQYQTVIMHYFNEMSVSEIAEVFDCSRGTVLSRLNYSRAKIRKAIEKYENENNDSMHAIVVLPWFSIFKAQSDSLEVPKINLTFMTEAGKSTLTKGAETVIKGTGKGVLTTMKSKVITAMCLLAVVSGGSSATAMFAGCGENQQSSVIETTMNTEADTTTPTLNDTDQAIIDAGLKVDDKGNIVDENGKKVEVSEDGKVEIKDEDGKTIKVDVDKVSEANTNNEKVNNSAKNKNDSFENSKTDVSTTNSSKKNEASTKPTEKSNNSNVKVTQATTKATEPKVTEKVTQPTTKATQPTTKATQPATQKPTVKPTEAPTQKPTEAPTEATTQSQWKSRAICNDCNADLTDLYHNDRNAFDDHLYNHVMEGGYGSYRVLNF